MPASTAASEISSDGDELYSAARESIDQDHVNREKTGAVSNGRPSLHKTQDSIHSQESDTTTQSSQSSLRRRSSQRKSIGNVAPMISKYSQEAMQRRASLKETPINEADLNEVSLDNDATDRSAPSAAGGRRRRMTVSNRDAPNNGRSNPLMPLPQDTLQGATVLPHDDSDSSHTESVSNQSTQDSDHPNRPSRSPTVGSNYDLLLARLEVQDKNDDPRSKVYEEQQIEEIRGGFERVYNEAVSKGEEDEIDWEFWSTVISDFNNVAKTQPKELSKNIQHGIPPALRGMIWQLFAKSKDPELEEQYMILLKEDSVYEKAIQKDLSRTFPKHEYFEKDGPGQQALFNVAKAYSLYDTEVGYCQGISFIVGPLLLNMPEEEAFCLLVRMMKQYNLRGHFTPQMETLHQRLYQFEGLMKEHLPHLHRHLEMQGIRASLYASQWFMTLFAYKFPFTHVYRIYDIVLAEGTEALFRFSLALMERNQETILSLDFDGLAHFLKNEMLDTYKDDSRGFVRDAYAIKITSKKLDRLAKQYNSEAAKASGEAEALETLRKQNKQLKDSVKRLENSINQLNGEHITVANRLIESKLEMARLNDENDALHQQSNELKRALDTLPGEVEARVKEEMEILCTKNAALVERNSALEEQLSYMESMIIDIKMKFAESENERDTLRRKLSDMKKLMGA
ncbi:GTPase-activating protein [Umbelopsis sp. WA50703]